jgi:hypothetical protein
MRFNTLVSGRSGKTIACALCATHLLLLTPVLAQAQGTRTRVETRRDNGLSTTTFTTPRGRIVIVLPDDAAPGDTVSATLSVARENRTSAQQQQNQDSLMRYRVTIGETSAPVEQGRIVFAVPATLPANQPGGTLPLILSDENGNMLGQADVRLAAAARTSAPVAAAPGEVLLPRSGRAGQTFVVPGRFDGDLTNTRVLVGGREAPILAESPRKIIVQSPSDPKGKTQIEVREADRTATAAFDNQGSRRRNNINYFLLGVGIGLVLLIQAMRELSEFPRFGWY